MMKQQFKCCVWLILMLLGMTQTAHAAFQDFAVELRDASGGILTSDETSNSQTITFGLAVDVTTGAVSRVAADDASAVAVITGKTGNNHGLQNFSATVPVDGSVNITMSTCSWGGTVSVKDGSNTEVTSFTTLKGSGGSGCYVGGGATSENLISQKYVGDATTLTISGGGYVGYFAIEAVQASSATVSYSLGDAVCEGTILPTGGTFAVGDNYSVPAGNYTLYKEGYTLTGWTDGTTPHALGSSFELTGDVTLTPVFTQNTVSLADRTAEVSITFPLDGNNGHQKYTMWGGGFIVTQATIGDNTIDVKADFTGSLVSNNGGWHLVRDISINVPSCKGATIAVQTYSDPTGIMTFDGNSDFTVTGTYTASFTSLSSDETLPIAISSDNYWKNIAITLPVVEQSGGGTTYTDEAATVVWAMTDSSNPSAYTANPSDLFSVVAFDYGDTEITGTASITDKENATQATGIKFKPSGDTKSLVWSVKPVAGLTFTPTKLSGYVNRCGTDVENGITISAYTGNNTATSLGTWTALRSGKGINKDYDNSGIYKYEIELTAEQQAAFASGDGFYLVSTVGVGSTKEGAFGEVTIEGLINGTTQDVNTYTLTVAASDAAAGSVSKYPVADEYEEGTTVKLTATPNFGYHFVNWTDGDNNVLSTDAVYNHEVTGDVTITANFQAVDTYELALTVDGTNDYMVTIDPLPTIVNDKMMYEAGTVVTLTANQYAGLVTFNNWSDGTTNSEKTITMDENKTYTAVYSQNDIIAGWDFYKAGGSGRVADFAAAENDADALQLINTETGATSGWLDKSTVAAGGYESFKGAAVNWRTGASDGDVGNWHWQTKVNAEAFQDINVQFQMMYNYNAYQKYNAEYSLDGENWTNFGSITMTGAKTAASFSEQLPATCNNEANLYIRMIADKTSTVAGAASANDGNTLAMFFITGTEQLADDPVAPTLVSSVPSEGADNASATGKIVLTFDKKVQVVEGTTATLGGTTLTPTVSGKTITFSYKNLDYATPYTFTLPANKVQNLTGTALEDAITINFTTMTRPTVTKGLYDAVVSNVDELVAAIAEAEARADKNVRYRIFLKNGEYMLPQGTTNVTHNVTLKGGSSASFVRKDVITYLKSGNISLVGESRDGVVITNTIPADDTFEGEYGTASVYEGIGSSDVLQLTGSGYYFQDVTVSTGMEDARGRDIAIQDKATKTIYKNVKLHGYQDTWRSIKGLYYFEGGVVRGRTDFLCGGGDAFFNGVDVVMCESGGFIVAPQGNNHYGYVFKDCTIKGEQSGVNGNYYLGRAWTVEAETYFINTIMEAVPTARGWSDWSNGPTRFAEYNSRTATGTEVDLDSRATTINGTSNEPKLSAEEADVIGDMSNSFGDWQPTLATEQAPVPTNVALNGTTLSWTGSDYALLYAIVKNGSVVDFTTDATYEVDDATATWAVRAANEMGGLSEASEAAVSVDLVLDDTSNGNGAKIVEANGQTVNVKVERTLSNEYYNTLFLPFAMTAEQIKAAFGEGVQVAEFTEMLSENTYGFGNVQEMVANKGYLVKPKATVNGFVVEGATITNAATSTATADDDWMMFGSYDTFNNDDTKEVYYFTTKNTIKKLAATGSIKGLRAFMCRKATAEAIANAIDSNVELSFAGGGDGTGDSTPRARTDFSLLFEEDTTTGISSASLNDNGQMINDAPAYNLAGQKVGKGYKGIVIKNGKKVVK